MVMGGISIDLQSDPDVPLGREVMEHLVGAHMVAHDEKELLHLVRHSIDVLYTTPVERGLRIMTHAAYRGQALILELLDLATRQHLALTDAGLTPAGEESERFGEERLDLWARLRDGQV